MCSIAGSTVSFIGAGTCVINANQAGNANYTPAPQVQQSFAVGQGAQTISFTSTAPVASDGRRSDLHRDGDGDVGPAGDVHDRRPGEHGVLDRGLDGVVHRRRHLRDQRQPGRRRQLPPGAAGAAVVPVGQGAQTISFTSTAPAGATVGGPTYTVTATATSGLPVTFTIDGVGEHGVLDCGLDGVVHRRRHLRDQRQPGGRRQLRPRRRRCSSRSLWARAADDQLHVDGPGRRDGRRADLHGDGDGDVGPAGGVHDRRRRRARCARSRARRCRSSAPAPA